MIGHDTKCCCFSVLFFLTKAKEAITLKSQSFDNPLAMLRSLVLNVMKLVRRVQKRQASFFLYFFPVFFVSFPLSLFLLMSCDFTTGPST